MRPRISSQRLRAAALVGVMVVPLSLAACAEDSAVSSNDGSGEGISAGASIEDYREAFEDLEPIELTTQTPTPKGSLAGLRNEDYIAAVEEWSGGKVTFEVQYASAVAAPDEADNALDDGRLDLANVMPVYEPSEYPAYVALNDASFVGRQTPLVGVLAAHAWMLDIAFQTEAMSQELADRGVHVLFPAFNSGHSMMICSEPRTTLDDFGGAQALAGGSTQSAQIESLGATPISIPFTEVYEALQRGVADCTVSSLLGVNLSGYAEVANQVTFAPDAGYAITTGTLAMSKETWDSLPLLVKQLLFDRLDVFLESSVLGTWSASAAAVDAILEAGGTFEQYDQSAEAALAQVNDELLEKVRENEAIGDGDAFVEAVSASSADWVDQITELGYEDVDNFEDFAETITNDPPDLAAFTDLVVERILSQHRPS